MMHNYANGWNWPIGRQGTPRDFAKVYGLEVEEATMHGVASWPGSITEIRSR